MLKKLYRWWLISWPVEMIHRASRRLGNAMVWEYDLFGERARAASDAEAKSKRG